MSESLPEPWRSALARKGIRSMRGLAAKAGVSPQTAKRLIDGTGSPALSTVEAVADYVFDGDRSLVWNLVGEERTHEPYEPPPEVALLTTRQRRALDELIRAMAESQATSRHSTYTPGAGNPSGGVEPELTAVLASKIRSGEIKGPDLVWAFDETGAEKVENINEAAGEVSLRRTIREALRAVPEAGELAAAAARAMSEEPRAGRERNRQDRAAEAPDVEGPEHGA